MPPKTLQYSNDVPFFIAAKAASLEQLALHAQRGNTASGLSDHRVHLALQRIAELSQELAEYIEQRYF